MAQGPPDWALVPPSSGRARALQDPRLSSPPQIALSAWSAPGVWIPIGSYAVKGWLRHVRDDEGSDRLGQHLGASQRPRREPVSRRRGAQKERPVIVTAACRRGDLIRQRSPVEPSTCPARTDE